jgi:primase-polymerase (primpol)-like protein
MKNLEIYKNIPLELRQKENWVTTENKKPDILGSFNENGNRFDSVLNQYANNEKKDGIGYILKSNENIVCIDFDNIKECSILWDIENWFEKANSYVEISSSGNGYHLFLKGKKPGDKCRLNGGFIEIYEHKRFIKMTGNVYKGYKELREAQTILNQIYYFNFPINEKSSSQFLRPESIPIESTQSDKEIIEKAYLAKNGDKFKSLFFGDISSYGSQSEADFALCSIIAFYTKDFVQIERIFNLSELSKRDKWNRQDYREATINKAIASCNCNLSLLDSRIKQVDLIEIEFKDVLKKTEKAFYFELLFDGETKKKWVATSQIYANTEKSITIPNWLVKRLKD